MGREWMGLRGPQGPLGGLCSSPWTLVWPLLAKEPLMLKLVKGAKTQAPGVEEEPKRRGVHVSLECLCSWASALAFGCATWAV